MAKTKKKTKKRNKRNFNVNEASTEQQAIVGKVAQETEEVSRAHETSCIFIQGCRVYTRNLDDTTLINEYGRLRTKLFELRNQMESFESLNWEMNKEKEFRRL